MDSQIDPIGEESSRNLSDFFDTILQMSNILETGLSSEQLAIVVELLNYGADSEELAKLILNLRKESAEKQSQINNLFRNDGHSGSTF